MNYKVIFDIYYDNGKRDSVPCVVEANNKKSAMIRAMGDINKNDMYSECYKQVKSIEEVDNDGD